MTLVSRRCDVIPEGAGIQESSLGSFLRAVAERMCGGKTTVCITPCSPGELGTASPPLKSGSKPS